MRKMKNTTRRKMTNKIAKKGLKKKRVEKYKLTTLKSHL